MNTVQLVAREDQGRSPPSSYHIMTKYLVSAPLFVPRLDASGTRNDFQVI